MASRDGDPGQVDVGGRGRAVQPRGVDDAGAAVLARGRGLYLDCQPVTLPPPLLHIGPGLLLLLARVAHRVTLPGPGARVRQRGVLWRLVLSQVSSIAATDIMTILYLPSI